MKHFSLLVGLTFSALLCHGLVLADVSREETVERNMASELRSYIAAELSVEPTEIVVNRVGPMNGQKLIFPGKTIKVRSASRNRFLGRSVFVVTTRRDGGLPVEQWISADVEQIRAVVVTRRRLRRFDVIAPNDVWLQEIRMRRQENRYETDLNRAIGRRVTRSFQKGAPIRSDQFEVVPLVRRGDRVTIRFQSEGLQIMTTGVAKQDGSLGKTIKVINLDSGKMVFAEVSGSGDVLIGLHSKE